MFKIGLKLLFAVTTLTVYGNAAAQEKSLYGRWISEDNDVLVLQDSTQGSSYAATLTNDYDGDLLIEKNRFSFVYSYYSSRTDYKKIHQIKYNFKIIKANDSLLWVAPATKKGNAFFEKRKLVKFKKDKYNIDKSIAFEKLYFHTTACFGSCPIIHMEIDNKKNVYIDYREVNDISFLQDDSRTGRFTAVLSDALYNELILQLQTCNLKTLKFPKQLGADAPVITLIVYFNGRRSYLKSMFPPRVADEIINYLYKLRDNATLQPTTEERVLEK